MTIGVYFYQEIPGAHPKWMVACFAVSQADADQYMKIYWKGGKRAGKNLSGGKINADCGCTTEAASDEIRRLL